MPLGPFWVRQNLANGQLKSIEPDHFGPKKSPYSCGWEISSGLCFLMSNESKKVKPQEALGHQWGPRVGHSVHACCENRHNEGTQRSTDFGHVLSILGRNPGGTDMTQLTKEMNKFDDMMNYLKRQLREVYSEAPKGCAVRFSGCRPRRHLGGAGRYPSDFGDGHGKNPRVVSACMMQ